MRIQISFEEDGKQIVDILEVGKDCTSQQAKQMIKEGKAVEVEEE